MDNWYIQASKSKDEHIKKLMEEYKTADDNKKLEIKQAVKVLIGFEDKELENPFAPETPKEEPEIKKEDVKEKNNSFIYSEDTVKEENQPEKLQEIIHKCNEEVDKIEKSRLKYETPKQRQEVYQKQWKIRRIAGLARVKLREIKTKQKMEEKKTTISKIAIKRAKFISLYRRGFSFTNICNHPDGVKKSEILEVVDTETSETCQRINPNFTRDFARWVEVKLNGAK